MEYDQRPSGQTSNSRDTAVWPPLPLEAWEETYTTLHRWTQIVGKIRLTLCADVNHWWHTTLYVTPRGLTTGPMPYGERTVQIEFDFLAHQLQVTTAHDESRSIPLLPQVGGRILSADDGDLDESSVSRDYLDNAP